MKANSEIPARGCILCAEIDVVLSDAIWVDGKCTRNDTCVTAILPVNHTQEDYDNFIKKLDVEYDDGYGTQELFGTIWLTDGTWMDRGEYDGSEWWQSSGSSRDTRPFGTSIWLLLLNRIGKRLVGNIMI